MKRQGNQVGGAGDLSPGEQPTYTAAMAALEEPAPRAEESPKGHFVVRNTKNLSLAASDVGLRKVSPARELERLSPKEERGSSWKILSLRMEPRVGGAGPGTPARPGTERIRHSCHDFPGQARGLERGFCQSPSLCYNSPILPS